MKVLNIIIINTKFIDSIILKDLYDKYIDDIREGNCCSRIEYKEFPNKKGLDGILGARSEKNEINNKNTKSKQKPSIWDRLKMINKNHKNILLDTKNKSIINENKEISDTPNYYSNICLDLIIPDEARWRICHSNKNKISELHIKLIYFTINSNFKMNINLFSNLISKANNKEDKLLFKWNWEKQNNWNGQCKSKYMQSPINIRKYNIKKPSKDFNISYNFLPVYTIIKKNQNEIITSFMNFGGTVKIEIDGIYLLFTPTYMSFRFPGEHLFEGKRYMGEIIIHLTEMSSQRVINLIYNK